MKRSTLYKLATYLVLLAATERFTRLQTGGFRMGKASVREIYAFEDTVQTPPPCLQQPFYFFGKGVQCYVFIGEDEETVLKLFKHHHFGPSLDTLKLLMPSKLYEPIAQTRKRRVEHMLASVKLMSERLKEERTGVFYTHLSKTEGRLGSIVLYDKIGVVHELDLDRTEFFLQRRGETASHRLKSLFQVGDLAGAIDAIHAIQALIQSCSDREVRRKDGNILENVGFIGDRPIFIDLGSCSHRHIDKTRSEEAMLKCNLELLGWIKQHHPEQLEACREVLVYDKMLGL